MHLPGVWGLLVVGLLIFLLFGKPGRLSSTMEDLGKGIRGFRKGMSDPDPSEEAPKQVADQTKKPGDSA